MTDDRRLEIERRFDGGQDGPGTSSPLEEPASDPEARRHLDRLVLLRELARRHDPAADVPRRSFDLPDRRPRRVPWWPAIAATAAAVVLLFWPGSRGERPARVVVIDRPSKTVVHLVEEATGRPPLEVELYGWANTAASTPKQGARLVLSPASASNSRRRSPANEILALELANASPLPRSGVQRFAVSKGPKPVPAAKPATTIPRAKATHPDV